MKTLLPVLTLALIIALFAGSSVLYMNMDYITSAFMTVSSIVGITLWIGVRGKQNETK